MSRFNSRTVREGLWVHKTKEDSICLDVVGCDYHREKVTLVDGTVMTMEDLTNSYMIPTLEGMDLGHIEKENLLGKLDKESNQPRQPKYMDEVEQVLENHDSTESFELDTIGIPKPVTGSDIVMKSSDVPSLEYKNTELTSEQRMVLDAIGISKGEDTVIDANVSVKFDFDIKKVVTLAKMFNIDNGDVAEIILSSEKGSEILKSILTSVIISIAE